MVVKDQILVALDVDSPEKAIALAERLREHVGGFKIGHELFTTGGPEVVRKVGPTFLDLKYHDIPKTVAGAAKAACGLGVKMFNVHCLGGPKMMRAAADAVSDYADNHGGQRPLVIGVTILTSHDRASLDEIGIRPGSSMHKIVRDLACMAQDAGLDGVVCSPRETLVVREAIPNFVVVTPGIRSESDAADDQLRTMSAKEAIGEGATYIVVGRPIIAQPDPVAAAKKMIGSVVIERI